MDPSEDAIVVPLMEPFYGLLAGWHGLARHVLGSVRPKSGQGARPDGRIR